VEKAPAPAAVKKAPVKKPAPAKKAVVKTPLRGKGVPVKKKKVASKFTIDCSLPAEDQLLNANDFEKFLKERIKIQGKVGQLANQVTFERGDKPSKVVVNANIAFSKRYLKYLTKKYLRRTYSEIPFVLFLPAETAMNYATSRSETRLTMMKKIMSKLEVFFNLE